MKGYLFFADRIQTRAQVRITGTIPMEAKRIRLPFQGLIHRAAMTGSRMDKTIPALFILDNGFFFLPLTAFGAGLNILGRIRMPEISRIKTRISLAPVKVYSFWQGYKNVLIFQTFKGLSTRNKPGAEQEGWPSNHLKYFFFLCIVFNGLFRTMLVFYSTISKTAI